MAKNKFKKRNLKIAVLIGLIVIYLTAGLHIIIKPETLGNGVIIAIGVTWVIEGICYCFKLFDKCSKK